uniref:Uncharacterized protein n=1 Tax=viral metagenome TaxID=1070528 RepID=A0A6C0JRZ0_9ZZZZ
MNEYSQTNLVEMYNKIKPIFCCSNNPDSNFPKKNDESDVSFPLSIVSRPDNRLEDSIQNINDFSTEMCFSSPLGYYIEIHGTDELLRRGYFLPQPKIIQPKDSSIIKIKLYKYQDVEDLTLPFHSGLSFILKNCNYAHLKKQKIDSTEEHTQTISDHKNFKFKNQQKNSNSFFG